MSRLVPILTLSLLLATPAAAKAKREVQLVRVPLIAGPVSPADMAERVVAVGEPFLLQRLTAPKSATLQADATVKFGMTTARFPKGTRLFLARGWKGDEFYCGGYGANGWTMGNYKVQWLCLQDADGDHVFERAWETPLNRGSYLPAFDHVMSGPDVSLAYTKDADDARFYYETAIVHQESFNLYGLLFFYQKVRREGETGWNDVASVSRGVTGGYTNIPGDNLPRDVFIGGAQFTVLAKSRDGLTIRPLKVPVGERVLGLVSRLGG